MLLQVVWPSYRLLAFAAVAQLQATDHFLIVEFWSQKQRLRIGTGRQLERFPG
jgi:hypothetical protein